MARIKCECGNVLSNSSEPEIQYSIFSNENLIKIYDALDSGLELINIEGRYSIESWRCPVCERLYIFREGKDCPARIYKLEKSDGESW